LSQEGQTDHQSSASVESLVSLAEWAALAPCTHINNIHQNGTVPATPACIILYKLTGNLLLNKVNKVVISHLYTRGVDNFLKTLANLVSRPVLLLAKTENNWPKI
jgi:hypothetical protein